MLTVKFRESFIVLFNPKISFHTERHLKQPFFKAYSIMVVETVENKLLNKFVY